MSVLAVRTVSLWWPFAVCLFSLGRHANVSTRVVFSQLNAIILKKEKKKKKNVVNSSYEMLQLFLKTIFR